MPETRNGGVPSLLEETAEIPRLAESPDGRGGDGAPEGARATSVRILIADDDSNESGSLHWALSQRMPMELVGVARDGAECLNLARRHRPDVVLLKDSVQMVDCLGVAETLADELPEVAVILMTTGRMRVDTRWRDLLRAGIAGFITYPAPLDGLLEQLNHVVQHQRTLRSRVASRSVMSPGPETINHRRQIVACAAPRGGCGRGLLACNLAVSLAARGHSVCLVDLDSDGGDIASLLDIEPRHSVGDLALAAEDIDREMIGSVLVRHATGVNVIPAPRPGTLQNDSLTPYFIQRLLKLTREQHEFTIVYTPPGLGHSLRGMLEIADAVVVMIGFDLIRLQQGAAFIDDLTHEGVDPGRIVTVLGSESKLPLVQLADAERILNSSVACVLPFDPATAIGSVNKGVPFVVTDPSKPLSKAVRALARRLVGDRHPAPASPWWNRVLHLGRREDATSRRPTRRA